MALYWAVLGFISGSVPWSLLVGRIGLSRDIRDVGDHNPGAGNVWKAGSRRLGLVAVILDIAKGAVPTYLAINLGGLESRELVIVGLAPVFGSVFSPFLKLKGPKSLSVIGGVWIAMTGGIIFLVALIFMGMFHGIQKTHCWTVVLSMLAVLAFMIIIRMDSHMVLMWSICTAVVIFKHKAELKYPISFRSWIFVWRGGHS